MPPQRGPQKSPAPKRKVRRRKAAPVVRVPITDAQMDAPRRVAGPKVTESRHYPAAKRRAVAQKRYDARLKRRTGGRKLKEPLPRYEHQIRAGKVAGPSVTQSRTATFKVEGKRPGPLGIGTRKTRTNEFDLVRNGKKIAEGAEFRRNLKTGKLNPRYKASKSQEATKAQISKHLVGPGLKVLEQTARPAYAIAGGSRAAIRGESIPKAVGRGATLKDKYLFSDVLKEAGVGGTAAAVGGLALDIVVDPTTRASFGLGSAGKQAARKAAIKATQDAKKAGASKKAADRAGRAAAAETLKKKPGRGIQAGARLYVPFTDKGIHPKTSGATTAAIGRKLAPARRKVRESKVVQTAGRGLVHDFRPKERTAKQHATIREAEREHRGRTEAGPRRVARRTQAVGRAVERTEDQRAVQDVIEQAPRDVPQHLADLEARKVALKEKRTAREARRKGDDPELVAARREQRASTRAAARIRRSEKPPIRTAPSYTSATPRSVLRPAPAGRDLVATIQTRAVRGGVQESGQKVAAAQAKLDDRVVQAVQKGQTVDQALKANRIRPEDVSPEVLAVAKRVAKDYEADRKARVAVGLEKPYERFRPQGPEDAQAYIPHKRAEDLEPPKGKDSRLRSTTRVPTRKGRVIREPLNVSEYNRPGFHSRDLPLVYASDRARTARDVSLSKFWGKVAGTGRQLGRKSTMADDEMVYRVAPHGLTPLSKEGGRKVDPDKVKAALDDREGRYVILNQRTVKDVESRLANRPSEDELLHAYDRAQGGLKYLYTVPNPSYHIRNLAGDSINAFLGDASAASFVDAFKGLRALAARNKAESTKLDGTAAALDQPMKLGKAGDTTLGKEIKTAEEHGALGGGFLARELPDLLDGQGRIARTMEYRENWPRLASYLSARKRGMNPSQAADWSLKHHFDYADMTNFERQVARRAIPFWTFFARNTRLQATKVFTRPGKAATLQKVLEEASRAAGFTSYEDYAGELKDYQQRGMPLPVRVDGKVYSVQVNPPQMDLNQLTKDPYAFAQDVANRVTFFKSIGELLAGPQGYSVFFQGAIAPEGDELTGAPPLVGQLPAPLRKKLGVVKIDGEWQWHRKLDYAIRALPEGNLALSALGGENPLRQQTRGQTIAGWATGAKVTTYGTPQQRYGQVAEALHEQRVKVERMRNRNQALDKSEYATPEYRKALDLQEKLTEERDRLRKKLGVKEPKKMRRKRSGGAPGGGYGGGFGSGFGGGY